MEKFDDTIRKFTGKLDDATRSRLRNEYKAACKGLEKVLHLFMNKVERSFLHEPKSDGQFKIVNYTNMNKMIKEFSCGDVR